MAGATTVLDTTHALYVWEWRAYPQWYVSREDVRPDALVDEGETVTTRQGTARRHGLRVGKEVRPGAALLYTESDIAGVAGTVRFEWQAMDGWFEEDEKVFVHPRSPYSRVDALRSTRHVRVERDGVVLAESSSPVLLFETGLRTRFYFNRTEVHFEHLEPVTR